MTKQRDEAIKILTSSDDMEAWIFARRYKTAIYFKVKVVESYFSRGEPRFTEEISEHRLGRGESLLRRARQWIREHKHELVQQHKQRMRVENGPRVVRFDGK